MSKFRIGLIGAPGSGKSEIALHLTNREPAKWFKAQGEPLYVAHNGGRTVENHNQAVGPHGSFREDYWALFETIRSERQAENSNASYVSCGTVWEPLAHASVNLEGLTLGIQTPQVEEEIQLRTAALAMLTIFSLQNFNCNYVFRVPYPKTRPNSVTEFDWFYGKKIEVALEAILDMQGLRLKTVSLGDPADQAQEIFAIIQKTHATLSV